MPKFTALPVNLTDEEIKAFNDMCACRDVIPAKKIGELIHGFLVAEGVKHPREAEVA